MLVDTSVWIDFLNGAEGPSVSRLKSELFTNGNVAITGVIFAEILQGAATPERYERLRGYFEAQAFLHPLDPIDSYAEAARLFFLCRRAGVTVRNTVDCLIAQIAIEHDVPLLHKDKDYQRIAQVVPELTLA